MAYIYCKIGGKTKHIKIIQMPAVEVPATKKEIVDYIICDLCDKEIKEEPNSSEEVEILHRTGYACSGKGSGKETSIDMCGKCFEEKFIPWLVSIGVKPVTKDWNW